MIFKQIKNLLFIFSLAIIGVSCEKVIDMDLNSSNPIPTVDAKLLKDSTALVRLSYTSDYFNNDAPQYIENAIIKVINQNDETETLEYISKGYYRGTQLIGSIHSDYRMEIEIEGQNYQAESNLLSPTEIFEMTFEKTDSPNPTSNELKYAPKIKFKSISENTNYFMFKFWVNGKLDSKQYRTMVIENPKDTIIYEPFRQNFDKDDVVKVRIYSINKETRTYYQQLNDNNGGMMGSSTPYNAQSNFGSQILGYFLASSYDEHTEIAQ